MMADYIKREDAINAALEQLPVCLEMDAVESALMELPAADVRPVVYGKWVHLCGDEWLCNACGFVISTEGSWEHPLHDREKFFCEHCGADMREVDDLVEVQDKCDDSCPIHFPGEQPECDPDEFFSAERSE